jgi:hypothetical protein
LKINFDSLIAELMKKVAELVSVDNEDSVTIKSNSRVRGEPAHGILKNIFLEYTTGNLALVIPDCPVDIEDAGTKEFATLVSPKLALPEDERGEQKETLTFS